MAIKIMLDAGHTGKYWNKGAVSGYYESAVMWKLHEMLEEELESYGFVVDTTRATIDTEMDVSARGKAAKGYDLLISLHSNSTTSTTTRRAVCIYQTEDSQGTWDTTSKIIADKMAATIAETMGVTWKNYSKLAGGDRDGDGKKDDNYYGVLHGARMVKVPAIIAEHSFHSNVETCRWLMDDNNLRKLARAEAACLADHFGLAVQKAPAHEELVPYEVEVKVNNLRIRKGPGTNYGTAGTVAVGKHTIVDESTGKGATKWGKLENGAGWISLDYATPVKKEAATPAKPAFKSYKVKVTVNNLRIRKGPGTNYAKNGIAKMTTYTITEESTGKGAKKWGKLSNGQGWIALDYTKKV